MFNSGIADDAGRLNRKHLIDEAEDCVEGRLDGVRSVDCERFVGVLGPDEIHRNVGIDENHCDAYSPRLLPET